VGLIFETEVPRRVVLALGAMTTASPVSAMAIHSFALDRSLGIAVVDKAVKVGDAVTVIHPRGTVRARVADVPFVARTESIGPLQSAPSASVGCR